LAVRRNHRSLWGAIPLAAVVVAVGATEGQGSRAEPLGDRHDSISAVRGGGPHELAEETRIRTVAGSCPATRVHGPRVRAGRFFGGIVRRYDVLDGRFRLHVGRYRDRASGLTQKIPWWISRQADVGRRLRINARRLPPLSPRTFSHRLHRASGDARRWVFPSIIDPPAEGCWRLDFSSGSTTGSLIVLVRD
jgi:hypothetical protein